VHNRLLKIPHFTELKKIILEGGFDAYFVGGCVRDILLDRPVHDVDMVCFSHDYKEFASAVKAGLPSVWVEFKDNIRLVRGRVEIDISKPRGDTLEEDLTKRDFTINNLAMDTAGNMHGDMTDINAKIVRHVSENTFKDDPIRILRTFRFNAQVGFDIAPETLKKIKLEKDMITISASERIFAELDKLFMGAHAHKTLQDMIDTGVYEVLTKGITPDCVDEIAAKSGRGLVFFAASLFRKLDKDEVDKLAVTLNFPNALKKRALRTSEFFKEVAKALENAEEFELRKLIYAYPDEMDDGLKLYEIESECSEMDKEQLEEKIYIVMTQLKYVDFELPDRINGQFLQEIGVAPGPRMGEIIKSIRPMLASGELKTIDEAVVYIKEKY